MPWRTHRAWSIQAPWNSSITHTLGHTGPRQYQLPSSLCPLHLPRSAWDSCSQVCPLPWASPEQLPTQPRSWGVFVPTHSYFGVCEESASPFIINYVQGFLVFVPSCSFHFYRANEENSKSILLPPELSDHCFKNHSRARTQEPFARVPGRGQQALHSC